MCKYNGVAIKKVILQRTALMQKGKVHHLFPVVNLSTRIDTN